MLGFSPWNPKFYCSPFLLIFDGSSDLLMIAATRGLGVLHLHPMGVHMLHMLETPVFFFFLNQPESYYGKWLGNRYNNPVSMCSSESGIILNSFQSVFEYFADASFVCHGLCLLLRYASAIWLFLPFCTKQCKK